VRSVCKSLQSCRGSFMRERPNAATISELYTRLTYSYAQIEIERLEWPTELFG